MVSTIENYLDKIIEEYNHSGFTAGAFGRSCSLIKSMIDDKDTSIFLSLSGALIPAGQQNLLVDIISSGYIKAIVTTGAMLTHDFLEDIGFKHTPIDHLITDKELRNRGVNRIYDMAALDEGFEIMEKKIHEFLETKYKKSESTILKKSIPELVYDLGEGRSDNSILGICNKKNIPIYCPALTDSMLGVHIMTFREFHPYFILDPISELKSFTSLCFDQKKTSAIVFGGGVPKNYLFQGMLLSGKELERAVQYTMDRPEHGGLSGASLSEAISWGKINPEADYVTVIVDVTLILPLLSEIFRREKK